jgi:vancomycin permeability regulator SanA
MTGGAVLNRFVESQLMLQFARSQGVPASAVMADGQAQNTIQNAYYAYKIMQAHDWTSALIVSSPTHLRRASLIFRYYPIEWRMDEAPWPPDYPLWKRLWQWCSEAGYTSYGRIFGFPNSRQYLPNTHFTFPKL